MAKSNKKVAGLAPIVAVDAPPVEVTVMEDRARVVRRGSVKLKAGRSRIVIDGVSPILSDKSLAVRIASPATAEATDVRARRFYRVLDEDLPEDVGKLRDRLEALRLEDRDLTDETAVLSEKDALLRTLLDRSLSETAEDASWGRPVEKSATAELDATEAERLAIAEKILKTHFAREDLRQTWSDVLDQFRAVQSPSSYIGAAVEVEVTTEKAGSLTFDVEYMVPGACWRPHHTARLEEGSVDFATRGCVWQKTGEDWKDVKLFFSTQRPTLGTEPPILVDDSLRIEPKPDEEVVETREQAIQTVGIAEKKKASTPELPGIDDAGEVQNLAAHDAASIPSDGRPYRIDIASFDAKADSSLVLMPELAPCAFIRSTQKNEGSSPVLAGPVDLIRQSGYVGRTSTLYVAPGEDFELGWGPDPEVRVQRRHAVKTEEPSLLNPWEKRDTTVRLYLSNIGATSKDIAVRERIPVSEVEKVQITFDEEASTGDPKKPDENGVVSWSVKLPPHEHHRLKLRYTLEKHKDIKGI